MTGEGGAATPREIKDMIETIRHGGGLSSAMGDPIGRLHLAVVRYVNNLGPGDVEEEYARVSEADRSFRFDGWLSEWVPKDDTCMS